MHIKMAIHTYDNIYNRLVRYQENEGIVLKLVPNVSSKLSKEFSESKATYTAGDRFSK